LIVMDNTPKQYLSKSRFMSGVRCRRLLWYNFNRREDIPEPDESTQALFESGKEVGELAQKLYPNGIKLEWSWNLKKNAEQTFPALALRRPLFESAAIFDSAYAQADILVPAEGDQWDLVEVKATSEVKPEHHIEVAFQKFVYEHAGIAINRCFLMHMNKEYVRMGELEPDKLFTKSDITEKVDEMIPEIGGDIESMLKIAKSKDEPEPVIGRQCNSPYECPMISLCWEFLPEGNILTLRGDRKGVRFGLLEKGVTKLADIPPNIRLSEDQKIQVEAERTGKDHINKEEIKAFLEELEYPIYFLDFETMNPAIPPYDMTRPFDFIAFEYSLHVVEREGAEPVHYSYIAPGDIDPRPEILRQLKGLMGNSGSILAWYATFEINCLRQASERYGEYSGWFEEIEKRFVDLLEPFRKLYYYSPKQSGSVSLKDVLPALTGKSYKGLEIEEGGRAMREYYRVTFDKKTSEEDRRAVFRALEIYCGQDTQGMVDILEEMKKIASRR
jgi:hypothetical protein